MTCVEREKVQDHQYFLFVDVSFTERPRDGSDEDDVCCRMATCGLVDAVNPQAHQKKLVPSRFVYLSIHAQEAHELGFKVFSCCESRTRYGHESLVCKGKGSVPRQGGRRHWKNGPRYRACTHPAPRSVPKVHADKFFATVEFAKELLRRSTYLWYSRWDAIAFLCTALC